MTLKKMNWNEVIPFSYKENKEIKSAFEPVSYTHLTLPTTF